MCSSDLRTASHVANFRGRITQLTFSVQLDCTGGTVVRSNVECERWGRVKQRIEPRISGLRHILLLYREAYWLPSNCIFHQSSIYSLMRCEDVVLIRLSSIPQATVDTPPKVLYLSATEGLTSRLLIRRCHKVPQNILHVFSVICTV